MFNHSLASSILHLTLFLVRYFISSQLFIRDFASSKTVLLHVFLHIPRIRLPYGFAGALLFPSQLANFEPFIGLSRSDSKCCVLMQLVLACALIFTGPALPHNLNGYSINYSYGLTNYASLYALRSAVKNKLTLPFPFYWCAIFFSLLYFLPF